MFFELLGVMYALMMTGGVAMMGGFGDDSLMTMCEGDLPVCLRNVIGRGTFNPRHATTTSTQTNPTDCLIINLD